MEENCMNHQASTTNVLLRLHYKVCNAKSVIWFFWRTDQIPFGVDMFKPTDVSDLVFASGYF